MHSEADSVHDGGISSQPSVRSILDVADKCRCDMEGSSRREDRIFLQHRHVDHGSMSRQLANHSLLTIVESTPLCRTAKPDELAGRKSRRSVGAVHRRRSDGRPPSRTGPPSRGRLERTGRRSLDAWLPAATARSVGAICVALIITMLRHVYSTCVRRLRSSRLTAA